MEYDVIVVGAGPAGSTAARKCAQCGLKTLLIDKETLPRHKTCGGGVTGRALSLLDFDLDEDLIEKRSYGIRIKYLDNDLEVKTPFLVAALASRDRFDMFLAEKAVEAGSELHHPERLVSLKQAEGSVLVKTDKRAYRANIVIGADGVNSKVAEHVREKFGPDELILALEAEVAREGEADDNEVASSYFGLTPRGYGWVFPKRNSLSVGICGLMSKFKNPQRAFSDFTRALDLGDNLEYSAHLIPQGGYDRDTCSDRILLVGDAAGFVDPFFCEGIYYAIYSGRIAAGIAAKAHEKGDYSKELLEEYCSLCRLCFGEDLKTALWVSKRLYGRLDFVFRNSMGSANVISKIMEIPGGKADYRWLRKWILLKFPYHMLKELFNK